MRIRDAGVIHQDIESVFGRPIRFASRATIDEFVRLHYRHRYSRYATPLPRPHVTVVPSNFASRLIGLRLRFHLTQAELARRIGAANKSVIHQMGNTQAHTVGRLLDSPEATRAGVIVNSEFAQGWRHDSETTYAATRRIAESRPPLST